MLRNIAAAYIIWYPPNAQLCPHTNERPPAKDPPRGCERLWWVDPESNGDFVDDIFANEADVFLCDIETK